jgi:hypothetical protein
MFGWLFGWNNTNNTIDSDFERFGRQRMSKELDELALNFLPIILADYLKSNQPPRDDDWRVGVCLDSYAMAEAFVKAKYMHQGPSTDNKMKQEADIGCEVMSEPAAKETVLSPHHMCATDEEKQAAIRDFLHEQVVKRYERQTKQGEVK